MSRNLALTGNSEARALMRQKVGALQTALSELPQYEPRTDHYFHGGMYCRKVFRDAGVLVVGKVHKKEHLYVIVTGRVLITDGQNTPIERAAGDVILSMPGTKRAVLALEPTTCLTVHVCEAKTVEEAERELVEDDAASMYGPGNVPKLEAIK